MTNRCLNFIISAAIFLGCGAVLEVCPVYAAGPSAVLTGTITPTGGGIACDYGPNFTGSIPAPAVAAGFTHCAHNSDFTQLGPISAWLGNCGATNPSQILWYNTGYANGATPCSDYNVEFDSVAGTNVLHMIYTAADAAKIATWMETQNLGNVDGLTFPNAVYVQTTWRSNAATQHGFDAYAPKQFTLLSMFSWCRLPATGDCDEFIEWDFFEAVNLTAAMGSGIHHWKGSNGIIADQNDGYALTEFFTGGNYAPSQQAIYHTYAKLVTQTTAGHTVDCDYLDGGIASNTSIDCGGVTFTGAANSRNYWGYGVGKQNDDTVQPPSNNLDMFIQSIVFFTCATWQTTACTH